MIGTFWNLCRACPSMPIDKNRSEYRSTYQWYEYTGPRQEVVKQAPQLTSPKLEENGLKGGIQNAFININKSDEMKKKFKENFERNAQPEVNIKRNPIFETKGEDYSVTDFVKTDTSNKITTNPPARVRSRNDRRDYAPSRRSKSEGPPGLSNKRSYYAAYGSPSPDLMDAAEFDTEYVLISNYPDDYDPETAGIPVKGSRGNTEYRLQFAWPKPKHASETQEELKAAGGGPRKSSFMATAATERPPVPVHKKRLLDTDKKEVGVSELEPLVDQNGECENNEEKNDKLQTDRLQFYSEYQKKFRPFSQYDYIAGKFLVRDNTVTPTTGVTHGSWYAEVLELRKKAGEYKHRGWGTELVPQHLAEIYNKQIALWEHVSRRSSLSALTLATTTQKPRALTKEEKSKENNRKLAPYKLRETRQASVDRAASVLRKKTEKNEEIKRHSAKFPKDTITKYNAEKSFSTAGTPVTPNATGRPQPESVSSGSPKKHVVRSTSSGSPKKTVVNHVEPRARPTTLATNAHTRNKRDTNVSAKKKESFKTKVSSQNTTKEKEFEKLSHEPKASNENGNAETEEVDSIEKGVEDSIIDVEHIVKSPPEPTRVKSPEQMMMKSPEPVNWTVPLDTGRTFTVTQNIPDDDVYHRPFNETKLQHHGLSQSINDQDTSSVKTDEAAAASVSSAKPLSDYICDKEVESSTVNGNENDFTKHSNDEFSRISDLPSTTSPITIAKSDIDEAINEKSPTTVSPVLDLNEMKSMLSVDNISLESDSSSVPISERLSPSTDVLDSARNRFEQFWNKPTFNGKETSM